MIGKIIEVEKLLKLEQAEEIKVKMTDGIILSGHLFKPSSMSEYPLIIFVTGSGGLSYQMDWQHDNFYFCRTLADICVSEGFALLLVDKRGAGKSEGDWKTQSFVDRADDMHEVILAMRNRPDILEEQISVAGQSQGGWVVQLLAERYPTLIKSALCTAGPAYSVKEQIVDNMESTLIMKGYKGSSKWLLPVVRLSFTTYQQFSKIVKWGYLSYILHYDGRKIIPGIKVPIYFAFAENDHLVPLERNEPLARALLSNATIPYKIEIVPGVNHGFAISEKYQTWEEIESKASPQFIEMVKDFCRWTKEELELQEGVSEGPVPATRGKENDMKHLRKGYGLDANGFIVRDVGLEKISNDYQKCIQETKENLQKKFPNLLHSVYVYGSVARGDAIKVKSDLDILAVFNRELQNGESVIIKKLGEDLSQRNRSVVREIGIAKTSLDYCMDPKNYYEQAFLRELCVCIDGEDLRGQFGPYKLTADIAISFNGDIRQVSDRYLRRLKDASDLEFPTIVQGFARKLIRTFYSMVMARSQIWSTRLDEQSEIFLQHFPDKAPTVHTLQKWIKEVPKEHSKVLVLLEKESKWASDNFRREATSID